MTCPPLPDGRPELSGGLHRRHVFFGGRVAKSANACITIRRFLKASPRLWALSASSPVMWCRQCSTIATPTGQGRCPATSPLFGPSWLNLIMTVAWPFAHCVALTVNAVKLPWERRSRRPPLCFGRDPRLAAGREGLDHDHAAAARSVRADDMAGRIGRHRARTASQGAKAGYQCPHAGDVAIEPTAA